MTIKNDRTPRTLAECQFSVGYQEHQLRKATHLEAIAGYVLACAIGAALAVWLVVALSS